MLHNLKSERDNITIVMEGGRSWEPRCRDITIGGPERYKKQVDDYFCLASVLWHMINVKAWRIQTCASV